MSGRTQLNARARLAACSRVNLCCVLAILVLTPFACHTYDAALLGGVSGINGASAGSSASEGGAGQGDGGGASGGDTVTAGSGPLGDGGAAGAGGTDEPALVGGNDAGGGAVTGMGGELTGAVGGASPAGGRAGAGGAAGGGSSISAGGAGGTAGGGGGLPVDPTIELIDDFEDGDLAILFRNMRNGPWYPIHDATSTVLPTLAVEPVTGPNAVPGSTLALHMIARGYTDWGAGMGADFVNTAAVRVPYNASAYKGVRFYAKIAAGTQKTVKVMFPTSYSDVIGGKCNSAPNPPAGTACNDHLFQNVPLTTTWALYQVNFSSLIQLGNGLKQQALDPATLISVQFAFVTMTLAADVWIDNLAFMLK